MVVHIREGFCSCNRNAWNRCCYDLDCRQSDRGMRNTVGGSATISEAAYLIQQELHGELRHLVYILSAARQRCSHVAVVALRRM